MAAHKAPNMCLDHEKMQMERYCRTCKKPVCIKCTDLEHAYHDWDTIATIAEELRKQTIQRKRIVESVSKSILIGTEQVVDSSLSEAQNEEMSNISLLEMNRKSILEFFNQSFDEVKSEYRTRNTSKIIPIHKRKGQFLRKRERLEILIQEMDTGSRKYIDSDIIKLHDEIHQILKELQALSELPESQREKIVYRPRTTDKRSLESFVGTIEVNQSAPVALLEKEVSYGKTNISSIHMISETEAWIHPNKTTKINLVNSSGIIKPPEDLGCLVYNITVSNNENMCFCDFKTKTVKKRNKNGSLKTLFSTEELKPLFVNITRSGDLLLTLADYINPNRDSSSRRLVRHTSMKGEVIMEFEFDNDGSTPLFTYPMRPVEHPNGNICVINRYKDDSDTDRGTVYGLHCRNNVIFKYNSIDQPTDVCFDNKTNILVSDQKRRIHILDSQGQFLRFLLEEESFTEDLYAMNCFGSKLWIGSIDSGLVKMFKIKY